MAQIVHFFFDKLENIDGKGENAGSQHFLLSYNVFKKQGHENLGLFGKVLNPKNIKSLIFALFGLGAENLFTEFMTYTATLCPNTTIEVYEGTEKTAPKLGTLSAKRADSKLPQIEFPAGSKPR